MLHNVILYTERSENMEEHSCCGRSTVRPDERKKKLINRLNRIEGQIRGIKGMIENDAYCIDILTQSAAVNAAVSSFNRELLNAHMRSCVSDGIREGREDVLDELEDILGKLIR